MFTVTAFWYDKHNIQDYVVITLHDWKAVIDLINDIQRRYVILSITITPKRG